ncbi:hypothetical protein [Actinacidiphila reveromycinica]|nr:hypothetical protein [Streptomyces sp. SN-593]
MSGTTSSVGAVSSASVTVDPDPCNALTEAPSGLLVPSTALAGVTGSGSAVSAARSVAVDVVAPADGDCPAEWQVGARLAPPYEEQIVAAELDLAAVAEDAWRLPGLAITLPEAGVYEVSATLGTVISVGPATGAYNIAVIARLYNVTADAAIPGTQFTAQRNTEGVAPTSAKSDADRCEFTKFLTVTESTRIRIEMGIRKPVGTPASTTGLFSTNHRLAYKKISD